MEFLKNQDMLMDIIDKTDIISKMKVGFWVIEYPEEGQPRMYGDPMMHLIMENDKEMSPEEGWDYRNAMIEYSKECVVSRRSGLGNRMYGTRVHDNSP